MLYDAGDMGSRERTIVIITMYVPRPPIPIVPKFLLQLSQYS